MVPPDDTQVNGAMLCCQCCHNIEAEYTEGTAACHQSLDLLHCPVGLNATGSKHFNSNENTMKKIKIKGQIITLLHHILSLLGVLNKPFWVQIKQSYISLNLIGDHSINGKRE